jgi:HEAT repeat protein
MIEFEDVRQWVEFDTEVRREWWYNGHRRTARKAVAFTACSPDGHEREAAVRRLAVSADPEALPLLLIRCVDWVPQVRAAARTAVLSKVDDSALHAMLPLIGVLRRRQVDNWMTELFRRALLSSLDTALALEDRESRRFAHREALEFLSRERLLKIAITHSDFVVRMICGDALLDRGDCVEELLAAGAPKVRVRALTLLGPDAAVAHLADPSAAVRTMAQALVPDPAAHYRTLAVSFGALAGLGETGTAADAPRLERHLADERPRIRRAAVRGLRRIAPESPAVRPLLTDPSPAVTHEVVAFLRGRFVDPATLRPLLSPTHPFHTRRAAAALLRDHDTWHRLHTDLTLLSDPDLADGAHNDIHAWLQHTAATYTTPSPSLATEIEAHLDRLPPETAREIRFALPGTRNSRLITWGRRGGGGG